MSTLVVKPKAPAPAAVIKDGTYPARLSNIKRFANTYGERIGFEFTIEGGGLSLENQALWLAGFGMMLAASIALGVLLVSLTGNLRICLSSAGVLVATSPAFSGFTFPLDAMGDFGRHWGLVLPITHYIELQQGQWMSGASLEAWAGQMLRLAAFTAGFLALGLPMMLKQIHDPKRWGRR